MTALASLGILVLTVLAALVAPTWEGTVRCCAFGLGLVLGSYLQLLSCYEQQADNDTEDP